jgi:electron transfer flavoprotein alpha subunit
MPSGILVFGEATDEGALNPVTAELIAVGTQLGGPVTCILAGSGVEGLAQDCLAAGADKVIVVDDSLLSPYQGDAYTPMAERITKEVDPSVVIMGQTLMGRDLAPRLAQRLGTAVAMDCVAL